MSERKGLRFRVLGDGALEIVDPDPGTLELIRTLDPGFDIHEEPLKGFHKPRLLTTKRLGSGVPFAQLRGYEEQSLWKAHQEAFESGRPLALGEVSLLDLKIELARRKLSRCDLCAHACGVDRFRGERGRCGLGGEAFVYESYTHIAEEPPINPALNISLRGCGMRCRYCQQFPALSPRGKAQDRLTPAYWGRLDLTGARSLAFIGGNPTESLPGILEFLREAPEDFHLPVVWNSSGYDAPQAIRLLDGICDVYVPDFKYGDDHCAVRLSSAPGYVANAVQAIAEMCRQGVPVLVRILVLPGHVKCCHCPALTLLSREVGSRVRVRVMSQYHPDYLIKVGKGELSRCPTIGEVEEVRALAVDLGLDLVKER